MPARFARCSVALLLLTATLSPQQSRDASSDVLADALIRFATEREQRDESAPQPVQASFLDGRMAWRIRSVRAGSPRAGSTRPVRALMTIERYLGWPTLELAIADVRTRFAGRPASSSDLLRVTSSHAGRDLSWMEPLFDAATIYDYAIDRVDARTSGGRYESNVTVKRVGNGVFSGTSTPRTGAFESGRGVVVQVTFADGHTITETWDGRDTERHFRYESAAPVTSAVVDPDGILVVDETRANNVWTAEHAAPRAGIDPAAVAWSTRWAVWLQDRLLLWSALF